MEVSFIPMSSDDYPDVAEIFRQGIATGNATFETDVPAWEKWDAAHTRSCRIVATTDNKISGWAALVPVSSRKVYSGVGEVSIYVSETSGDSVLVTVCLQSWLKKSKRKDSGCSRLEYS